MQSYQDLLFQVQQEQEHAFFRVPDSWKSEYGNGDEATPFLDFLPWPIRVTSLMFADGTEQSTAGGGGGGGGSQTPWLSNIDAANYYLYDISAILGSSSYESFFITAQSPNLWFGTSDTGDTVVGITYGSFTCYLPVYFDTPGSIYISAFRGNPSLQFNNGYLDINTSYLTVGISGVPYAIYAASGAGRVGINIPPNVNPQYTLDVFGDINITDPGGAGGYTFRINGVPVVSTGTGQPQTPWLSNIDAAGYELNNLSSISSLPGAGLNIDTSSLNNFGPLFNYGGITCYSGISANGNININDPGGASGFTYRINGVPIGGESQTPWLSDIDAAGYSLNNLGDHINGLGYFYLNADSAVSNLYLSTNAGVADTRAYGAFSHYLSATNLPNVILDDGGVRINAGSSQDGLAVTGTPAYAQIRLVPTYGFGTAVLIQNDGTNLTIRGAPSSNYFGPGTTTQLTIALPNGNAFFAGIIQAADFLVGGVSIVSRIAALEAAIGA